MNIDTNFAFYFGIFLLCIYPTVKLLFEIKIKDIQYKLILFIVGLFITVLAIGLKLLFHFVWGVHFIWGNGILMGGILLICVLLNQIEKLEYWSWFLVWFLLVFSATSMVLWHDYPI
ncbi:MAG: hypothetical protein JXA99_03810 [Candidatus Lokiarchaeota archaeon]|nr:hypothetical protein [Candidatus Lokiarchaeota archaeon]